MHGLSSQFDIASRSRRHAGSTKYKARRPSNCIDTQVPIVQADIIAHSNLQGTQVIECRTRKSSTHTQLKSTHNEMCAH
jgi:hypothetical protein